MVPPSQYLQVFSILESKVWYSLWMIKSILLTVCKLDASKISLKKWYLKESNFKVAYSYLMPNIVWIALDKIVNKMTGYKNHVMFQIFLNISLRIR